MEILLWLLPAVVVTVAAMIWVGVLGRRLERDDLSETARVRRQQRFAEAIQRPHKVAPPRRAPSERSTGLAVREQGRQQGSQQGRDHDRRSA